MVSKGADAQRQFVRQVGGLSLGSLLPCLCRIQIMHRLLDASLRCKQCEPDSENGAGREDQARWSVLSGSARGPAASGMRASTASTTPVTAAPTVSFARLHSPSRVLAVKKPTCA